MEKQINTSRLRLDLAEGGKRNLMSFTISAEADGKELPVGMASMEIFREDGTVQLDIYVNPDYRRRGYGAEAGDALIDEIIKGYPKYEIFAAVPCDDEAANRFCERLDFIFDCSFADENVNIYYM